MYILGISAFYHDSAACLLKDGKILAAVQEERFSRKKHDERFPKNAIRYCLESQNIKIEDIDYVAFYEKPFLKFERLLETYLAFAPKGLPSFLKAIPLWLKEKLWMKSYLIKELGFKGKIIFPEHHLSHAASAFYPSPFEKAAFLTADGVGEWATTSFGVGSGHNIKILADIKFPHSLGMLYSAFTYYTGFKVNSGEYKVMGLAPYGRPLYKKLILEKLIHLKEDGSFRLNMDYFNYCVGLTMTNENFHKIFNGPPRKPESPLTQKEMDLARSIQEVTEDVILKIARHIRKETGQRYLCLAGGVALNCVANSKILEEKIFDDIWIQPASGDAGGALGAALVVWYEYLKNSRKVDPLRDSMQGAYLGPSFSEGEIRKYLNKNQIPFTEYPTDKLVDEVSTLLGSEKVVGWFQGRMEFGPRALGNRSILGDARSPKMQEIMNLKIKFRESFRPFAPSVIIEKVSSWFETNHESPFMLLVASIKKEKQKFSPGEEELFGLERLKVVRSEIPAVTHVDLSARLQTVHQETNPLYHQLINAFDKKFHCPVVINTSFNVRGEPIVCTPEDAYRCFMRTNIDYLVLGHFILDKKDQTKSNQEDNWQKEFELD